MSGVVIELNYAWVIIVRWCMTCRSCGGSSVEICDLDRKGPHILNAGMAYCYYLRQFILFAFNSSYTDFGYALFRIFQCKRAARTGTDKSTICMVVCENILNVELACTRSATQTLDINRTLRIYWSPWKYLLVWSSWRTFNDNLANRVSPFSSWKYWLTYRSHWQPCAYDERPINV